MILSYLNIKIFHSYGINMRYLCWIASNTTMPHIKEICQVEMIARSCKKMLRFYLAEMIMNFDLKKNRNFTSNKILIEKP